MSASSVTYDSFFTEKGLKQSFEISDDLNILSTIRFDPNLTRVSPQSVNEVTQQNFFLFAEHIERLKYTLEFFLEAKARSIGKKSRDAFQIDLALIYSELIQAIAESGVSVSDPLKIRLLLDLTGTVNVELYQTPSRPNLLDGLDEPFLLDLNYDIYVDTTPVLASPFTSFKTTKRDIYNTARARCLPGSSPREEVVLVNTLGEVTEGSITNIAIRSVSGDWVTPKLTCGCLCGVTRLHLLKKGLMKEGTILLDHLKVGQEVLLMNGIMGVSRGTIRGFKEELGGIEGERRKEKGR